MIKLMVLRLKDGRFLAKVSVYDQQERLYSLTGQGTHTTQAAAEAEALAIKQRLEKEVTHEI